MVSNFRIGGLASGMDIDQLVKDLMSAARKPVDLLKQNKLWLQWKKDDYRSMNMQLRTLRDEVSKMRIQSTFLSRKVNSSDSEVATATSSNNAATTSYTLKVTQLAEAARNQSSEAISASGTRVDPNKSLWSQRDKLGLDGQVEWILQKVEGQEVKVTVAGTKQKLAHDVLTTAPATITVKNPESEVKEYTVVGDPEKALTVDEVYLNSETGELVFGEEIAKDSTIVADYTYNTKKFNTTFKVHNESGSVIKTFTVEAGNDTLNSLFNRMSANKDLGIAIFYDASQDKVSISTNRTGDNNPDGAEIIFGSDGFFTKVLKLDESGETGGKDAAFILNGLSTTRKSNDFTINGTTFSLKGKLNVETTINVTHDGSATFEAIKSFIDKYNEIVDKVDTKVKEERDRNYLPLTDEQKKEMKENDIKLWEEKARSGNLRSDPLLRNVLDRMRSAWSAPVRGLDPKLDQMAEYGIETGSYFEGGKLYIKDEQKLKKAIEENPDAVIKFFTKTSDNYSEKGVAQRLYDTITTAMNNITKEAGSDSSIKLYDQSNLAERIRDIDKRISAKETRLTQLETRYWKQFTAMEQAIQRSNMQSAWLAQQFGGW